MAEETPAHLRDLPTTVEDALDELRRLELAAKRALGRKGLLPFTQHTFDGYQVNWHHRVVAEALDRVIDGSCRRLMLFMPPQNGKSELVSRRFPARALGKNPDLRIVACSYNVTLAQDMSRDVQKIMSSPAYQELYPGTRLGEGRDAEKRTQGQFEVVGHRGSYIAAGVDGTITGKTADIGIIDDPIKNREEAESEVYRQRVWNFYTSAFSTRQFGDQGAIIICMTRWHQDDLAGKLLELARSNADADQWEVISLPAVAEQDEPPHRRKGQALWPAKYPLPELRKRRALGEYDFSALYQQRPAPSGGGLFKVEWFADRFLDAAPSRMRVVRCWDTAGTEQGGDWTVGVKIGEEFTPPEAGASKSTGRFVILDVVRGQWGPAGVDGVMRATAEADGKSCAVREEREGGSAGPAVIAARTKTLAGFDYAEMEISGRSKVTRSKPFRAQCEAGNVYLLRAEWNTEYLKELGGFPTGKHDDQVDASSGAFNAVLLEPEPEDEWFTW